MVARNSVLAVISLVTLAAFAVPALAEESAVPTVTVSASTVVPACEGMSPDEARSLAQQAQREGAHRKAADCFRIAGDLVKADREQVRASSSTKADTSAKLAANAETAKAQARKLRDAFR